MSIFSPFKIEKHQMINECPLIGGFFSAQETGWCSILTLLLICSPFSREKWSSSAHLLVTKHSPVKFTKKWGHIFLLSSLDEISNKIPSRHGNLPRFSSKHNRSQQAKLHVPPGKTDVSLFVCTEQLRCNSGAAISGHESIVVTFEVLTFFALGGLIF